MFRVYCSSKTLDDYPAGRIIGKIYKLNEIHRNNSINNSDYTNALASDIKNSIEATIEDPDVQSIMKLAKNKVHDLIAMSETFRALFGRRDFEEE